MLGLRWDIAGRHELRWPEKDEEVIAVGEGYVAHEESLPPEQRLAAPALDLIKPALDEAKGALQKAGSGEIERAGAAGDLAKALLEAREPSNQAILSLKSRYISNLAMLEAWGLKTVATKRGISVRMPGGARGRIAFLRAYVEKEQSLPEGERQAAPSLETMSALNTRVQASLAARDQGRVDRQSGVATRSTSAERLRVLLQAAAVVLVATRFGGSATRDLEAWSFRVVERTAGTTAQSDAGNGSDTTGSSASTPTTDPATNLPA